MGNITVPVHRLFALCRPGSCSVGQSISSLDGIQGR